MRKKTIKHAHTALRWGLGAFVIGIISFILAISLIERPLENPIYIDVLAMTGVILACLGFLTFTIVSLIFLPGILKIVAQHTQKQQKNNSNNSVVQSIFKGVSLLLITIFEVLALLISNSHIEYDEYEKTRENDIYNNPFGDDITSYYNWSTYEANDYEWKSGPQ